MSRTKFRMAGVGALTALALLIAPMQAQAASVTVGAGQGKCYLGQHIAFPHLFKKKGAVIATTCFFGGNGPKGVDPTKPSIYVGQNLGKKTGTFVCIDGVPAGCGVVIVAAVGPGPLGGPWCGHSAGPFGGVLPDGNILTGSYVSAGGKITASGMIAGGGQAGPFVADSDAVSDVAKGETCSTKPPGADIFRVSFRLVGVKA